MVCKSFRRANWITHWPTMLVAPFWTTEAPEIDHPQNIPSAGVLHSSLHSIVIYVNCLSCATEEAFPLVIWINTEPN